MVTGMGRSKKKGASCWMHLFLSRRQTHRFLGGAAEEIPGRHPPMVAWVGTGFGFAIALDWRSDIHISPALHTGEELVGPPGLEPGTVRL